MFVERVALAEIPMHARIEPLVLQSVLTQLGAEPRGLRHQLDRGFHELQARQPCLADFVAGEIAQLPGPRIQALGYFLAVLVYRVFEEAFGSQLSAVQLPDVSRTLEQLVTDSQLRSEGAGGSSYSEDAIAVGQPALISLLRNEIDRAVSINPDEPRWDSFDAFYESLLVLVLVLTQAVAPSPALHHSS
jgi:hypothetical protein